MTTTDIASHQWQRATRDTYKAESSSSTSQRIHARLNRRCQTLNQIAMGDGVSTWANSVRGLTSKRGKEVKEGRGGG